MADPARWTEHLSLAEVDELDAAVQHAFGVSDDFLAIGKDQLTARNRAEFAARVQSHDWDAVVITHSTFSRWPVSSPIMT